MPIGTLTHHLEERAALALARAAEKLPVGVCGRLTGVALVTGVVDSYGEMFASGCLAKSVAKVAAGKCPLFLDHNYESVTGHVGVVRELTEVGNAYHIVADLFDSFDGRRAKEYLASVQSAQSETDLSIGFHSKERGWHFDRKNGETVKVHDDIELAEVSITPRGAVPGATVTSVRKAPPSGRLATMEERLEALRRLDGEDGRDALDEMVNGWSPERRERRREKVDQYRAKMSALSNRPMDVVRYSLTGEDRRRWDRVTGADGLLPDLSGNNEAWAREVWHRFKPGGLEDRRAEAERRRGNGWGFWF